MEHETMVRNIQYALDFLCAVGPAIAVGIITHIVANWESLR